MHIHASIQTTLDGPFKPVTVKLDPALRGHAIDLPSTDPRMQRRIKGFQSEQIAVSLSSSHHSVCIFWVIGEYQIGNSIKPLDPTKVSSIVYFGRHKSNLICKAFGESLIYSQFYPFEGLQNHTSGIIHHSRPTGLMPKTKYYYRCGGPSIPALSKTHYFKTMPESGRRSYPARIAVAGDLGLTYSKSTTVDHIAKNDPDILLIIGDMSYANLYLTNGIGSDCLLLLQF